MPFKRFFSWILGKRHDYGLNRQSMFDKVHRHWHTFLTYNTLKKMINLIIVFFEGLFRRKVLHGKPPIIKIEPTVRCNLRCRGCIHSMDIPLSNREMPMEMFKKICDDLGDYLYKISLYIIGEPLLNRDIYDMIRYAADKRIGTVISSNFHAMDEKRAERLIKSGLSHLIIALDSLDQQIYEQIRVGGKVDRVLNNLEIFMKKRDELKSRTPYVELQTIRNDLTRPDIPKIADLVKRLGIERHTIRDDLLECSLEPKNKACFWLWHTMVIDEEGRILPCCPTACTPEFITSDIREFGNIMEVDMKDVWNTPRYVQSRILFTRRHKSSLKKFNKKDVSICFYCSLFRKPDRIHEDAGIVGLPVEKIY